MVLKLKKQIGQLKIFHPILFAIFPVISIYSYNINILPINELIFPLLLTLTLTIASWSALRFILHNNLKASLIVSLFLVIYFLYGHFFNLLNDVSIGYIDIGRHRFLMMIFSAIFIIGTYYLVKTKRLLNNATIITNVISILLIVITLSNIGIEVSNGNYYGNIESVNREQYLGMGPAEDSQFPNIFSNPKNEIKEAIVTENEGVVFPDIYYIVLDEYGSQEELKDFFVYDNSEFISFLSKKGFFVVPNSHTNYPTTVQALGANLNMRYPNYLSDEVGKDSKNFHILNELLSKNKVMHDLKLKGYKIINLGSLWGPNSGFELADANLCEFKQVNRDSLMRELLHTSILGYLHERWTEQGMRDLVLCVYSEIPNLHKQYSEPIFVFAHVLLPHPPYIFGPNGESVTPGNSLRGETWDIKTAHIDQLQFANKKTKE